MSKTAEAEGTGSIVLSTIMTTMHNDNPSCADNLRGGGDCSSESMGSGESDGEESVPMKQPAEDAGDGGAADADDSFLDDDFLSFPDDGEAGERGNSDGKASAPSRRDGVGMAPPGAAPWMMPRCAPVHSDLQQRGRGYGGGGGRPPPTPLLVRLHNEIVCFARLMEPTAAELAQRDAMVRRVTELALRTFGKDHCEVLPFGSQATGLCLPGSDIDFVIRFTKDSGKEGGGDEQEEDGDYDPARSNPLHAFADAVREEFGVPGEFDAEDVLEINGENRSSAAADDERLSYLEVIEHTRVPLVKFTVFPQMIDVDVCFDQPNGPESADLMHRFMESMPPLRPLTFALKYFLSSRDINKPFTGGIGSYLLQLMIVSFLQHRSREDASRGCGASGRHFNLGSLLVDFFELYGCDFNYVTAGISVRHDGYYFPKGASDRREVFCSPRGPFALAVENPLDVEMDVGAGAFRMQMISRIFGHAYKTLVAYVSEPALLGPEESVLARILPVSPEMEKRRAMKAEAGEDWAAAGGAGGTAGARETGGRQRGGKHRKRNSQRRVERGDDGGGGSSKRRKDHGGGNKGGRDVRESNKSRKHGDQQQRKGKSKKRKGDRQRN